MGRMNDFIIDTFGNFVYLFGIKESGTTEARWWIADRYRFADLKVHKHLVHKHIFLRIEDCQILQ